MLRPMPLSSAPCRHRALLWPSPRFGLIPSRRTESLRQRLTIGRMEFIATSSTTPPCSSPRSFARVRTLPPQPSSSRRSPSQRIRHSAPYITKSRTYWSLLQFSKRRAPPDTAGRQPHALLGCAIPARGAFHGSTGPGRTTECRQQHARCRPCARPLPPRPPVRGCSRPGYDARSVILGRQ